MNRQIGIVGLPDELALGAVVLDRDGIAWQHCRAAGQASSAWVRVGVALFGGALPWARLVVDRGPLTPLVPEPDDASRTITRAEDDLEASEATLGAIHELFERTGHDMSEELPALVDRTIRAAAFGRAEQGAQVTEPTDGERPFRCRVCDLSTADPHDGGPRYFITSDLCHPCGRVVDIAAEPDPLPKWAQNVDSGAES